MPKTIKILFFFFILSRIILAQTGLTIMGDSLVGKLINGEKIREVIGNVVIEDNEAKITCNKAVQYLESGNIQLFGNVIFNQDTLRLFTERAFYESIPQIGIIDTNLILITRKDTIKAKKGKYLFSSKKVFLIGKVSINSSSENISCDSLIYFRNNEKIIAFRNVKVNNDTTSLSSEYFEHSKLNGKTIAKGNVYLKSKTRNTESVSDFFLYSEESKTAKLFGLPIIIKIDSAKEKFDTLFISAKRFITNSDKAYKIFASDSVKIFYDNFSLVSDTAFFNNTNNEFTAISKSGSSRQVTLWFENSQITGDTIKVTLENREIKKITINGNANLIETIDSLKYRYNQISGSSILLNFRNKKLKTMNVFGKTLNIYYIKNNGKTEGLIKSSSETAVIRFDSGGVAKVKLYGNPESEYHPIKLVSGKERDFLIPSFFIYPDKPKREDFLKRFLQVKNSRIKF